MGSLTTIPRWSSIFWNSEAASPPWRAARYASPRTKTGRIPVQPSAGRRDTKFVRRGYSEDLDGLGIISADERNFCAEDGQEVGLHEGVFRKPLVQIVGQRLRSAIVTRIRKRKRGTVLHVTA